MAMGKSFTPHDPSYSGRLPWRVHGLNVFAGVAVWPESYTQSIPALSTEGVGSGRMGNGLVFHAVKRDIGRERHKGSAPSLPSSFSLSASRGKEGML